MGYMKKTMIVLKSGDLRRIFRGAAKVIGRGFYLIRARIEDWRIGRISINKRKPTKYAEQGAKATESTNYDWLDQMFKAYPVPIC